MAASPVTNNQGAHHLLRELQGVICRCGKTKYHKQTFCRHCFQLLPGRVSAALYRRMGEGYEEAYAEAVKWLDYFAGNGIAPEEVGRGFPPLPTATVHQLTDPAKNAPGVVSLALEVLSLRGAMASAAEKLEGQKQAITAEQNPEGNTRQV